MDSWSLFQLILGQSLCKTKVQVLKTWDYAVFILVMSCSCFYPENSKKKNRYYISIGQYEAVVGCCFMKGL